MLENIPISAIIFALWLFLEFAFIWGIIKYIYLLSPSYKKTKIIIINFFIYLFINIGLVIGINIGYPKWLIIFIILAYIKTPILLNSFYEINKKVFWGCILFIVTASFIGNNIHLIAYEMKINIFEGKTGSYLYEIAGLLFLIFTLMTIVFFRINRCISLYIKQMEIYDYILFFVIIECHSICEIGIIKYGRVSMFEKILYLLAIVCTAIFIVRLVIVVEQKNINEANRIILENHVIDSSSYYKSIIHKDELVRKYRHDIKNLIEVLKELIEEKQYKKALSFIGELQEKNNECLIGIETGNIVADSIINLKVEKAHEKKIDVKYNGLIPVKTITDSDLVIMISNILDNAIEACEKVDEEKTIIINSIVQNDMWIFIVKNTSLPKNIIDNHLSTCKKNNNEHGYGLNSIECIANKYNGQMKIEYYEGYFISKTSIMLI